MGLQSDIKAIFTDMMDYDNLYIEGEKVDGNKYMSVKLGNVIKDYVAGLTLTPSSPVTGTDAGPSGAFTGEATVSWEITGTTIADKIYAACTSSSMNNDYFAEQIGAALDADAPTWTASLAGMTTPPGSSPTASQDSATITAVYQSAPVVADLKTAFASMVSMYNPGDDPNEVFASTLASAIETYYTTAVISGKGATHLSGCVFTVTVTVTAQS